MQTAVIDGNDPEASYAALHKAMDYVRTERKPFLLEAMVSRLRRPLVGERRELRHGARSIACARFEQTLDEREILTRRPRWTSCARIHAGAARREQAVREEPQPPAELDLGSRLRRQEPGRRRSEHGRR